MEGRGPPRASSMMIGRGTRNYARPIPIVSLHERRLPSRKHQVSGDTPGRRIPGYSAVIVRILHVSGIYVSILD